MRLQQIVVALNIAHSQDAARRFISRPIGTDPICQPFPAAPPNYGHAPLEGTSARVRAT